MCVRIMKNTNIYGYVDNIYCLVEQKISQNWIIFWNFDYFIASFFYINIDATILPQLNKIKFKSFYL